jgi:hypothetical protein
MDMSNTIAVGDLNATSSLIFRKLMLAFFLTLLSASMALAVQPPQDQVKLNKPLLLPPLNGPATLDFGRKSAPSTFSVPATIDATPTPAVSALQDNGVGIARLTPPTPFRGDGYTQDSASKGEQRTKGVFLPGISLKVPLY